MFRLLSRIILLINIVDCWMLLSTPFPVSPQRLHYDPHLSEHIKVDLQYISKKQKKSHSLSYMVFTERYQPDLPTECFLETWGLI